MDNFEIIDIDIDDRLDEPIDRNQDDERRQGWWLVVPVLVAVGLLVWLTRGSVEAEEAVPPVTTMLLTPSDDERTQTTLGEKALRFELAQSFAGQVMLTGDRGGEMTATQIDSGVSHEIELVGEPLYVVDGWLVFQTRSDLMVVDLTEPASEPEVLLADVKDDGYVSASAEELYVTIVHQSESMSADTFIFEIGSWDQSVGERSGDRGWTPDGFGLFSSQGNGIYELTADGYRLRGQGTLVSFNRQWVITWECTRSLQACGSVLRDRESWDEVRRLGDLAGWVDVSMAPESPVAASLNWNTDTAHLLDLATGDRIEIDTPTNVWVGAVLGDSVTAVILSIDGNQTVIVDRKSGAAARMVDQNGVQLRGELIVSTRWPYLEQRIDA